MQGDDRNQGCIQDFVMGVIPHVSVACRGSGGMLPPKRFCILCCMRWILTQSEG